MSPLLTVDKITCRYDRTLVFRELSLSVEDGSIACLLGPSGCGKTTALRAIAGFEPVQEGSISLDGQLLSAPGRNLPPEKRQIGMVFQDYALFPHLDVSANIAFGLHGLPREEREEQLARMLRLIRMEAHAKSWPHQLSGGQQQRVALARALAPNPRLLLLDEPFSNLDTELRRTLSLEVRDILKRNGTTAILVTHDQSEAFNVADCIGVMDQGRLLQWGSAQDIYQHPATPFVAAFVSQGQLIPGTLEGRHVSTVLGSVTFDTAEQDMPPDGPVQLLLRPWNIVHDPAGPARARILGQQFHGAFTQTTLQVESAPAPLLSHDPMLADLPCGAEVSLSILPRHLQLFPAP